jgi:Tfp pilus assembly protein PilV
VTGALAYARAYVRERSCARDSRSMSRTNGSVASGPQGCGVACRIDAMADVGRRTEGAAGMSERMRIGGRGRGGSRDGGFTLVEAIVASVILLVAGTAVITALLSTGNWYASANARAQATSLASQQLAAVRSRSYTDIEVGPSILETRDSLYVGPSVPATQSIETSIGTFTVATSITSTADATTQIPMKYIEVSVSALSMASPVSVWGYATEATSSPDQQFYVPVTVNCVAESDPGFTNATKGTGRRTGPNKQLRRTTPARRSSCGTTTTSASWTTPV